MPRSILERAEPIGKGLNSDVYAWGERCVLKLFHGRIARAQADREYAVTQAVHAVGLPVPAAYEMIEIDGRCGIVLERIDGVSMLGYTQARPWALFAVIRQFTELHARIHQCQAPAGLRSLHERIAAGIDASDAPEAHKQTARERLAALPDGDVLCHGDFHPENVLVTPRGLVAIDWESASRGDPIGDVACTSRLMRTASLPPWSAGYMHLMLKGLRPLIHGKYLKRYLRLATGTRQQIEAWQTPLAVAARSWKPLTTAPRSIGKGPGADFNL
jgi:Ser/Thr protein kinase RdoA (MazF antagonist)